MKERRIVKKILDRLRARGAWATTLPASSFTLAGMPDLLVINHGRAYCLEVKQPGKKAKPIQEHVMREIREVGGAVARVVTSPDEAEEAVFGAVPALGRQAKAVLLEVFKP